MPSRDAFGPTRGSSRCSWVRRFLRSRYAASSHCGSHASARRADRGSDQGFKRPPSWRISLSAFDERAKGELMSKLRVQSFAISVDGYGAGPRQDRDNGLGVGGQELHKWFLPTRTFKSMYGKQEGTTGVDD